MPLRPTFQHCGILGYITATMFCASHAGCTPVHLELQGKLQLALTYEARAVVQSIAITNVILHLLQRVHNNLVAILGHALIGDLFPTLATP